MGLCGERVARPCVRAAHESPVRKEVELRVGSKAREATVATWDSLVDLLVLMYLLVSEGECMTEVGCCGRGGWAARRDCRP